MRVLSIVHDPAETGGGGLFERLVVERGDALDRWIVADGSAWPGGPGDWDALMVFGGSCVSTLSLVRRSTWSLTAWRMAAGFIWGRRRPGDAN